MGADVLALDQDPDAIAEATNRLSEFGNRVTLRRANFRHADRVLDELEVGKIGGAILDLGVSSRQLEHAERGFSLMRNGPLDMRMDPSSDKTAGAIINSYREEELTRLFRDLGEEPAARRIASAIVKQRKTAPFRETLGLARAIEKIVGRHGRRHPATQVFQALRMEVNDELGALEQGLRVVTERLEPGARIAVISFHSLEDRMVKNFFRDRTVNIWIGRNGRSRARTKSAISSSSPQGRWSRAKTNNVSMRGREARNCGLPKNWDEPLKATQSGGGSFAGALDSDHRSAGGGGTLLCLSHLAVTSFGRSHEIARDRAGGSSHEKICRDYADRGAH